MAQRLNTESRSSESRGSRKPRHLARERVSLASPNTKLRVFHKWLNVAVETRLDARVASEGPRATIKKRFPWLVGRGPVPRHAFGHRQTASPL